MALRSCTKRYFPMLAFFTGKIGVLQVTLSFFTRMPAVSMSEITGLIPAFASVVRGYYGLTGLYVVVVFTTTGSAPLISPTSVGPIDHSFSGNRFNSGNSSSESRCHSLMVSDM